MKFEAKNLTDWHCHLLPDLDDGPATMEESVEMARALIAAGFTTVCCTPHLLKGVYEKSAAEIRRRTEELQLQLVAESIPLQLIAGTEYSFDEYLLQFLDDPLPLPGGNILVEAPFQATAAAMAAIESLVDQVLSKGFTPLVAHPERSPVFTGSRERGGRKSLLGLFLRKKVESPDKSAGANSFVQALKGKGCRFQGNLGSFAGYYGEKVRSQAIGFLESGLYDCFGSDAHRIAHLEEILRQGIQTVNRITITSPVSATASSGAENHS